MRQTYQLDEKERQFIDQMRSEIAVKAAKLERLKETGRQAAQQLGAGWVASSARAGGREHLATVHFGANGTPDRTQVYERWAPRGEETRWEAELVLKLAEHTYRFMGSGLTPVEARDDAYALLQAAQSGIDHMLATLKVPYE